MVISTATLLLILGLVTLTAILLVLGVIFAVLTKRRRAYEI